MEPREFSTRTANAVKLYNKMSDLYDGIERQTWMSVEQRDTMLHALAVIMAQYEGIVRWCIGEVDHG